MIDDTDHPTHPEDAPQDAGQDQAGAPDGAQPDAHEDDEPPIEQQIKEAHPSVASLIPDDYDPLQSPLVENPVIAVEPGRKRPPWYGRTGAKRRFLFALKAQKALEYRKLGYDYTQIAQFVGYANRQGAHYAVKQALRARSQELADEVLSLDLARLDDLYRGVAPPAIQGDLQAVASAQSIISQRSRLLGLEKPAKVAMTDADGKDVPAATVWSATMAQAAAMVAAMAKGGAVNLVPDEPDVPEPRKDGADGR